MLVKHAGLLNVELNVGGTVVRSDERGIFDVPESVGLRMLDMKGYHRPKETKELGRAYAALKKAEVVREAANKAYELAKHGLTLAQQRADSGGGTPIDSPDEPPTDEQADEDEVDTTPDPEEAARKPSRRPKAPPKDDGPSVRLALVEANKGRPASMSWKQEDLLAYARSYGISAESDWSKAQIFAEIEEKEDEG